MIIYYLNMITYRTKISSHQKKFLLAKLDFLIETGIYLYSCFN